ncbi:hypothetical protein [Idiomarina abyssalis]|uniref:hypothetical protein n=1 Tax=Idiomarina abyssalis TaxID=86102 RepID=UPI003A8E8AAE
MTNADMPAMPVMDESDWGQHYGLTKREYFAGLAMQGLLASGKFQVDGELSREAWSAADQMLWQQEQEKNK